MEQRDESHRAQYVCDYEYDEWANSLATCQECGWPIGRHRMAEPERFKKGPFRPAEPQTEERVPNPIPVNAEHIRKVMYGDKDD